MQNTINKVVLAAREAQVVSQTVQVNQGAGSDENFAGGGLMIDQTADPVIIDRVRLTKLVDDGGFGPSDRQMVERLRLEDMKISAALYKSSNSGSAVFIPDEDYTTDKILIIYNKFSATPDIYLFGSENAALLKVDADIAEIALAEDEERFTSTICIYTSGVIATVRDKTSDVTDPVCNRTSYGTGNTAGFTTEIQGAGSSTTVIRGDGLINPVDLDFIVDGKLLR
jgi:hypothetical protein